MAARDFDPTPLRALGFPHEPEIDAIAANFFSRLAADLDALDPGDREEVERLTHRLRGAAGSLGFRAIEEFLTPDRIAPGTAWRAEIDRLILAARLAFEDSRKTTP